MKTACIAFANGCSRAEVDVAQIDEYFRANGWEMVDDLEAADVVIVTSCTFDEEVERDAFRLIGDADRRRKTGSTLVSVGCTAGYRGEELQRRFDIELVPPRDPGALDTIIGATVPLESVRDPQNVEPYLEAARDRFGYDARNATDGSAKRLARRALIDSGARNAVTALGLRRDDSSLEPTGDVCSLRVARGCVGNCSYCTIRIACGPLVSRPLDDVLADFDAGLASGFSEFRLIAQDLGAYGQDQGISVVELLAGMFDRPGDYRLTLIDFDVRWLVEYSDELVPLLAANAERIRYILAPLQSGSEKILGLMRRGHTAAGARDALVKLREAAPEMMLSTHIIVGFPGETEAEFQETVEFLRAVRFDHVDVFDFCARPETDAFEMSEAVPEDILADRSARLRTEFQGRLAGVEYRARRKLS